MTPQKQKFRVPRLRPFECDLCDGKGGFEDYVEHIPLPYVQCPICDGTGRITLVTKFWQHAPEWFLDLWWTIEERKDK